VQRRLLHPEAEAVDCGLCRKFATDEKTRAPVLWAGQYIPRQGPPPCECDPPADCFVRNTGDRLSEGNELLFQHYCEGRAVGFTDEDRKDEFIRDMMGVIHRVFENAHYVRINWAFWGKGKQDGDNP
jgi:hypothetical protein